MSALITLPLEATTVVSARRAPRVHQPSKSQQPGIVLGLRYERRLVSELRKTFTGRPFTVEHNPWFYYRLDDGTSGACCPDILLHDEELSLTWVIEVKYTWVRDALPKLENLYCPVVELALSVNTTPLVITKRLTPESPMPKLGLLTPSVSKLFQWAESGPIVL